MPLYELTSDALVLIQETSFATKGILERSDLQRLLCGRIGVIDDNLLVLCEEFGNWEDSKRRIDILAIDGDANLVVVELKRDEKAGHVELQALRYAAMIASMTFDEVVDAHQRYLDTKGKEGDARELVLNFLEWDEPEEEEFAREVRIILVAANFSKEVTSTALWLSTRYGLDIRCVRLRPHALDGRLIIDVQQIIPLPEADDYQVRVARKERLAQESRRASRDYTRYDLILGGKRHEQLHKRHAIFHVVHYLCSTGVTPEEIVEVMGLDSKPIFRSAEGRLSADEFQKEMDGQDRVFDLHRWFCTDNDLIHYGGRTWALSNQWGTDTEETLEKLGRRYGDRGVSWQRSE